MEENAPLNDSVSGQLYAAPNIQQHQGGSDVVVHNATGVEVADSLQQQLAVAAQSLAAAEEDWTDTTVYCIHYCTCTYGWYKYMYIQHIGVMCCTILMRANMLLKQ